MTKVLAIAGTTLRQLTRDRTALFFTVLFPFVIILFIGMATAGLGDNEFPVGFVDAGAETGTQKDTESALRRELRAALARSDLFELVEYRSQTQLFKDVRRGSVLAGIVVPDDYDEALRSGRTAEIVFASDPSKGFPAAARAAVAAVAADQGGRIQAARFATANVGGTFEDNLEEAASVERTLRDVTVRTTAVGPPQRRFVMSGFEYTAPANFVLFVFITSLAGAGLLIESRRLGVTRRMLATPTPARTIVAGQTLGRFAIAAFQGVYILALGRFFFGVNFGDPLGAFAVALLFVLVGTSVGVLFGTLFRTPEQAGTVGPVAGIAMGMLAGCMWPRFVMPEFMQRIGQLFPHAWAMDAWIKLIARGEDISGIATELAVLAGFVVVLLPIAAWRLRRSVVAA